MSLHLQFDAQQQYQKDAIDSIVDIFEGQSLKNSKFTIARTSRAQQLTDSFGIGNKLDLDHEDLMNNVIKLQDQNSIPRSKNLIDKAYPGIPNFTIEMETGTGKTYVYTRTIFELYKKYGFSKFIIVVPSVPIREGVLTSLDLTQDHFSEIYEGVSCHYFKYDSKKPNQTRDFAESDQIEIMIINIDAFRKGVEDQEKGKETNANLIFRESDGLQGNKPIDFITQTNPIVIIDEPQSVDNTQKSKEAIKRLNPLCILRYSATHRETYNLLYRLGPVEAYEQRLVKKIEVAPVTSAGDNNTPYLKLISVDKKGSYSAKLEINVNKDGSIEKKTITVNSNSRNNLYRLSGELDMYREYIIAGIETMPGNEGIEFESGKYLRIGEVWGGTDDLEIKRAQIRATIYSHLNKEAALLRKGIKIISLFFLDKVENYRVYGEDGAIGKGVYASIFEEEYQAIIKEAKYNHLFTDPNFQSLLSVDVDKIHDGYFAMDKKGKLKNSTERGNADDEQAYELIMKDKERLLSFDTPLRFIFSHSALKEGWDNPNVFQICTLVETQDTFTKRQKIGRGLRLPVNQNGNRVKDEDINILTVVANESYESFAKHLQEEMEKETGVKFGYLEPQVFSHIIHTNSDGEKEPIGYKKSEEIYNYLQAQNYIRTNGKVEAKLKEELAKESFVLPEEYSEIQGAVITEIKQVIKKLPVFNADEKVNVTLNKEVLLSEDFKTLWEKIKYKTNYRISFDTERLVESSIREIRKMEAIPTSKILMQWARVNIEKKGVSVSDPYTTKRIDLKGYSDNLPDLVRMIEENTGIKRSSIIQILIASKRLNDFTNNPQKFIEQVIKIINDIKKDLIVDGIKYEKIGDEHYYTMEQFEEKDMLAHFLNNTTPVDKSVYSHAIHDSDIEKTFAERMNENDDVKLFVKLPDWFTVDTPLGKYNPDWALVYNKNGVEKLYFVVETKGNSDKMQLRFSESGKIHCARKHFESISEDINYEVVSDYDEFEMKI